MKKTVIFNLLIAAFLAFAAGMIFAFDFQNDAKAFAEESVMKDGAYDVKVSNDMPMGKSNISERALLEKNGDLYYLTITFKRRSIDNPELKINGKNAGQIVVSDSDVTLSVMYTLSESNVFSPLAFSVYVVPMKKDKTVILTVDKTSAVRVGEFDTSVKRAPEFVADGDTIDKRDHSSDMPVWGYALIFAGAVVLIAAAIVVTIVLVKNKKKKAKAA